MTTLASAVWRDYMYTACDLADYPSAVFSGILPDALHLSGYHVSIEDNPSDNHSVILPDDKAPPGDWPRNLASAGDRSMNKTDMILAWNRWFAIWKNRANDPRAKYFRAYNGWKGIGDAERLDFEKGTRTYASPSHKWHDHREGRRRYVNDPELKRAGISAERGETIEEYLIGGKETMATLDEIKVIVERMDTRLTTLLYDADTNTWIGGAMHNELNAMKKRQVTEHDELMNKPVITEDQLNELADRLAEETNPEVIKEALRDVLRQGTDEDV